jgi:hypothetical protein
VVRSKDILLWLKRAIAIVLGILAHVAGKLAFDLYMHDFINIQNITSGTYRINSHDLDENAFLLLIAVVIAILMLPFINKLRMGDVEIEVESTGYRPVGPASVTMGLSTKSYAIYKVSILLCLIHHKWHKN